MRLKRLHILLLVLLGLGPVLQGQDIVNDVGLRMSLSAEKRINRRLSVSAKLLTRQMENLTLLNRVYVRTGLKLRLGKQLKAELRLYYMPTRKGYRELRDYFRYAFLLTYEWKLGRRFTLADRVAYQTTTNYLPGATLRDGKLAGVIRNRYTLKFKQSRRGEPYIAEELLFQVAGKKQRYFGRNRVYLGYEYRLSERLSLDGYVILERGYNDNDGPQERTFFYGLNLGYNF